MRILLLSMFVIIAGTVGCTSEQSALDEARQEISNSVIGDPEDKRYILFTTSYDLTDEDAEQERGSFPEPTPELIRSKVNALPWNDERFIVTASIGQGSIYLPEHKNSYIADSVVTDDGETLPLTAEIDEAANGEFSRKKTILESSDLIVDLLIAYLQNDEAGLAKVEWVPIK